MKDKSKFINKTLEEIEQVYLNDIPVDSSYLIRRCYALRKKKLSDYTIEDLRIMIGQKEGLKYLIPIAIEHLKDNPFAEGDFYEGDLLQSVLKCKCEFWKQNVGYINEMNIVVEKAKAEISTKDILEDIKQSIIELMIGYINCISIYNY